MRLHDAVGDVCDQRTFPPSQFSSLLPAHRLRSSLFPSSLTRTIASITNISPPPHPTQILGALVGAFGGVIFGLSGAKSPFACFLIVFGGLMFVLNGIASCVRHHLTCNGQDCCILDGGVDGRGCNCYAAFQQWIYAGGAIVLTLTSAICSVLAGFVPAVQASIKADIGTIVPHLTEKLLDNKMLMWALAFLSVVQLVGITFACMSSKFKSDYAPVKKHHKSKREEEEDADDAEEDPYAGPHGDYLRKYEKFKPEEEQDPTRKLADQAAAIREGLRHSRIKLPNPFGGKKKRRV